ncbi:hypothetical protein SHI21_12725 [Bacteriovorax sp. PP10]|uniref:Outer membrane protein beta-barrel domain-containing protein n=1 Tax=Bacteriovorax antarcticus TaxID=3088717 RepID=A0ABU5VVL0_9BACT|nr:hypothetical protein [Bacteriovorax sp. PP10]MEA9357081.1 hypothetical protein [Bacteriovorax sp. PP10]
MKNLLFVMLAIFPISSFAIVNEVAFDFGYDRTVYGTSRQNNTVTRSYSGVLSTYIFDYTAIDLSASRTQDTTSENERYTVATGIDLVGQQNRVRSSVYGIGLKQMFAPRTARLIPGISVGYAKQFLDYESDVTVEDTVSKARLKINNGTKKQRIDSVFGTFSLQLRMTERLSLKGSVKTLFPAFEMDKARDNVKYAFGFSWVF